MSVYLQALNRLVTGVYLKPSTRLSHISRTDRLLRLEAKLRKEHKGIPTAKDVMNWKIEAEARIQREEEEAEKVGMVSFVLQTLLFDPNSNLFESRNARQKTISINGLIKYVAFVH